MGTCGQDVPSPRRLSMKRLALQRRSISCAVLLRLTGPVADPDAPDEDDSTTGLTKDEEEEPVDEQRRKPLSPTRVVVMETDPDAEDEDDCITGLTGEEEEEPVDEQRRKPLSPTLVVVMETDPDARGAARLRLRCVVMDPDEEELEVDP